MNRIGKFLAITILASAATVAAAQGYNGPSSASAAPASARYAGPSTVPGMTAKELLANGVDDQYVTLTGKLVRHTGGDHYVLADASGEIRADISAKHFPQDQVIDANTVVELEGKFDKERFGSSKLEVKRIKVIAAK
ncbi:NirD/YgiW/YdeI family stress tolerance protein [Collimonas pratensis]|uniref:YgiW/YdeI family stress tolerance OB fold protein n=1 Tax=Collimonas pratensis TaxID=279113 RepID=UPI00143CF76B|nr:NirD/YgiW/YdeI family stress tolerance protein [Collimonas pratensis]NKI68355.1 NirD/YgiW/YdeI family stress tolerance protein [Collimonas pratensis]